MGNVGHVGNVGNIGTGWVVGTLALGNGTVGNRGAGAGTGDVGADATHSEPLHTYPGRQQNEEVQQLSYDGQHAMNVPVGSRQHWDPI